MEGGASGALLVATAVGIVVCNIHARVQIMASGALFAVVVGIILSAIIGACACMCIAARGVCTRLYSCIHTQTARPPDSQTHTHANTHTHTHTERERERERERVSE